MNADAFRYLYDYHFAENRKLWDSFVSRLAQEQFSRPVAYSQGSVRNQIVHLMSVDDTWFSALRGVEIPEPLNPADFDDRDAIRAFWNNVEHSMRAYLAGLRDELLFTRPFSEGEDENIVLWQVLIQVVNHGTDHRAQLLRQLNDLGLTTPPQDFIFHVYDNP